MKYEVALFDLDYTLFDSARSEREALELSFTRFNIEPTPNLLNDYRKINSQLWAEHEKNKISLETLRVKRFEKCLKSIGSNISALEIADSYSSDLGNCGGLLPGAQDLLNSLKGKIKLGLVTNGVGITQRKRIRIFELEQYFDSIVISGEFGSSKPNSPIFEESMRLMGHKSKRNVLMIGDSAASDMAGAQQFGIDSCWFNPEKKHLPDGIRVSFTAHSFEDILSIIF